jgi:hypothetical protein|tara:strand:- start:271 stop:417 length:147 start_codon:yes stop_codon:yes gene_type:complete
MEIGDVCIALPIRMKMKIREHKDPDREGWYVLFFMFWIAITIVWNYLT